MALAGSGHELTYFAFIGQTVFGVSFFGVNYLNEESLFLIITKENLRVLNRVLLRFLELRREPVRLFPGLALVFMLWGCGPSYSERIWDRGLRPVIQVIPERDWATEVPMCPSCLATTTRLPLQNYLIKVRWGQWDILEHEFRHIWEWETTGTTDHVILLHDKNPMQAASGQEKTSSAGTKTMTTADLSEPE